MKVLTTCVVSLCTTAVCLIFLLKLKWPKNKSVYDSGTLCCVLGEDTLLSQRLSPPGCINGHRQTNAGGNPAMD